MDGKGKGSMKLPEAGAVNGRRGCSLAGDPQPHTAVVRSGISQSSAKNLTSAHYNFIISLFHLSIGPSVDN